MWDPGARKAATLLVEGVVLLLGTVLLSLWEMNTGKIRCRCWKSMQQVVGMLAQKWRRFRTSCHC